MALNIQRQCPLVLMVKIGWKQSKVCKEVKNFKVMESGLLWVGSKGKKLSILVEFLIILNSVFGWVHFDKNLIMLWRGGWVLEETLENNFRRAALEKRSSTCNLNTKSLLLDLHLSALKVNWSLTYTETSLFVLTITQNPQIQCVYKVHN